MSVSRLLCVAIGTLALGTAAAGQWRLLTPAENGFAIGATLGAQREARPFASPPPSATRNEVVALARARWLWSHDSSVLSH